MDFDERGKNGWEYLWLDVLDNKQYDEDLVQRYIMKDGWLLYVTYMADYDQYIKRMSDGSYLLLDNFSTTPFILTVHGLDESNYMGSLNSMYENATIKANCIEDFKCLVSKEVYKEAKFIYEEYISFD
jgi:hypothetical protein